MTDHFDHEDHLRRLEEAEALLRRANRDDLAGAVSRAAALHRDVQGRVSHSAQAIRQLDIARRAIGRCCPLALQRVMRARGLLDNYACRRSVSDGTWLHGEAVEAKGG